MTMMLFDESAAFWLPLILAIILLVAIMLWSAKRARGSGFGGWLMPIVIAQSIAPLRSLWDLIDEIGYWRSIASLPQGTIAASGEAVIALLFLAIEIATTIAMLRRRRSFPIWFLLEWLALIGGFMAEVLILSASFGTPLIQAKQKYEILRFGAVFAAGAIALLYLYRSARVRNTFTR